MLDFDCGKWSEIDDVRFPSIVLGDVAFESLLSIRVLELLSLLLVEVYGPEISELCWSLQVGKQPYFLWIDYQEDHLDKID